MKKGKGKQDQIKYIKDKEGNLIGDEETTKKIWKEYFEEKRNGDTGEEKEELLIDIEKNIK